MMSEVLILHISKNYVKFNLKLFKFMILRIISKNYVKLNLKLHQL